MDKKSCERETQEKRRKSRRYIVVGHSNKKIEYKYIMGKTKENKSTNLWEKNPRQKRVPKGI
jgi:hypothetical protein